MFEIRSARGMVAAALIAVVSTASMTANNSGGIAMAEHDARAMTPVTTEPVVPEPSTPPDTEPGPEPTTPPDAEPEPGETNDSDDTTVAIIAVIGFAALIALASWWMLRRQDDDDAPHPRPPTADIPLPGQDLL